MKTAKFIILFHLLLFKAVYGQGTWTQLPGFNSSAPLLQKYGLIGAIGLSIGDTGYVISGYNNAPGVGYPHCFSSIEKYSATGNSWQENLHTPPGREFGFGFVIGGKAYFGGGYNLFYTSKSTFTDFWEYNPSTGGFTEMTDLPNGTSAIAGVGFSVRNKGYLIESSGTVLEYDPTAAVGGTWTQKSPLPFSGRAYATGFSIGNYGFLGTGYYSSNNKIVYQNDFWQYDPIKDNWQSKASLPTMGRYEAIGFSIGSKGYIGLGDTSGKLYTTLKDFWEYDPSSNSWKRMADWSNISNQYGKTAAVGFSIGTEGFIATGSSNGDAGGGSRDIYEWTPGVVTDINTIITEFPKYSVFPNPASEFVNINFSSRYPVHQIVLTDLTGKILHNEQTNRQSTQLDIKALSPGVYLIKLANENEVFKIVKQ